MNLIDLAKTFPTNMWLRKSASIPPRMSLSKFTNFRAIGFFYFHQRAPRTPYKKASQRVRDITICATQLTLLRLLRRTIRAWITQPLPQTDWGGENVEDDRSVKISSLEALIMKIKWLVLGCIDADFCD